MTNYDLARAYVRLVISLKGYTWTIICDAMDGARTASYWRGHGANVKIVKRK